MPTPSFVTATARRRWISSRSRPLAGLCRRQKLQGNSESGSRQNAQVTTREEQRGGASEGRKERSFRAEAREARGASRADLLHPGHRLLLSRPFRILPSAPNVRAGRPLLPPQAAPPVRR